MTPSLAPWSLFAALIAAAGLPIYIHTPTVYAETYGIGLGALGLGALGLGALGLTLALSLGSAAFRPPYRLPMLCRHAIVPPAPPPTFTGHRP